MTTLRALTVLLGFLLAATGCSAGAEDKQSPADSQTTGPALTVPNPTGDYQQVEVSGTGLPNENLTIAPCELDKFDSGNPNEACDLPAGSAAKPVGGKFTESMTLRVLINVGTRREVNCIESDCVMAVIDGSERILLTEPIHWADDVVPRPAPSLLADRARWGGDSPTARVHGRTYPPNAVVRLVQCPRPIELSGTSAVDVMADSCAYDQGVEIRADAQGSFAATIRLVRRFRLPDGTVLDCRRTPERCVIAAPWPVESAYGMSAVRLR